MKLMLPQVQITKKWMNKQYQEIDGILLLDKPQGFTSNAVLQKVRHLFQAKKAGHTGTLDPLATGMLPICFGEATKFSQYVLDADKAYTVTAVLGTKTDSADAMGKVLSQVTSFNIAIDTLREVLSEFVGDIKQIPSMFSALKHQGKPLYQYARAGQEVVREARDITIHELNLLNFDGKSFSLSVHCSKGTYIRNLIDDIGERLNVGAHVVELHRVYTAGFSTYSMITLEKLQEMNAEERLALLLPVDEAVKQFPKCIVNKNQCQQLQYGQIVTEEVVCSSEGIARLYLEDKIFLGLGEINHQGELSVKRLTKLP